MGRIEIIDIKPFFGETVHYSPARFIIRENAGEIIIDSYGPEWGWLLNRSDMTKEKLEKHIENMRKEGFLIDCYTVPEL